MGESDDYYDDTVTKEYAMDHENVSKYLASISPHRLDSAKPPRQLWKSRARCFSFFDGGLRPRDISPRQCKVKRRTLYRYYQDWKLLKAKTDIAFLKVRPELDQKRQAARGITIPRISAKGE